MKRSAILPALLLTLASVYFLYVRASNIISPDEMVRPLITAWLVLLLFFPLAYWVLHDWNLAGLFLVVVALGVFSTGIFAYTFSILIFLILILLWGVFRILLKRKLKLSHIFLVLNIVSLVAIIMSSTIFFSRLETIPSSYYRNTRNLITSKKYVDLYRNKETTPDIYFIILDGYGRSDILRTLYNFDNSKFEIYLEHKGFVIPEKSRSNYPKTVLSVASMLNMDYIQSFASQLDDSIMWWLMSPWLDRNLVRTSLERIGYKYVSISTYLSVTDNQTADYYFKSHPLILSEFERYLLGSTPLKMFLPLLDGFFSAPTFDAHRHSQLNNFEALVESKNIPGPKFVFAHIILPHPPFVFSSNGAPRNPRYSFSFNDASHYPESPAAYRDQYLAQMQFLNDQMELVIDSILINSPTPPIIILQADHGPGMLTDFNSATNTCLAERFSTFSAYLLPNMDAYEIPPDITPVNLFRLIFNEYYDAGLPLLDNVQYYPVDESRIYDLNNVTASVDAGNNCYLK